jgi:hypothetical protein
MLNPIDMSGVEGRSNVIFEQSLGGRRDLRRVDEDEAGWGEWPERSKVDPPD